MKTKTTIFIVFVVCIAAFENAHAQTPWFITGNSGTSAGNNFIGTIDNVSFKIRTKNIVRLTITGAGNTGIGTTTPTAKLHIKGNTNTSQLIIDANSTQSNTNPLIRLRTNSGNDLMWIHSDDSSNIFIGKNSGRINNPASGGLNNIFIGKDVGKSNIRGSLNTGIGFQSFFSNDTGIANTVTGAYALYSNFGGHYNTSNGFFSLFTNTTGNYNTVAGSYAMLNNTTGSYNIAIGASALQNNQTGYNNIASGYESLFNCISGGRNVGSGYRALFNTISGSNNTALGYEALYSNIGGVANTAVGTSANSVINNFSNTTGLGFDADPISANTIYLGNISITSIKGQVGFTTYSDQRFKKNVSEEGIKGLEFITRLRPVTYNVSVSAHAKWKEENHGEKDTFNWEGKYDVEKILFSGFLAQEVEATAKEVGYDFSGVDKPKNDKDIYGLRYAEFVVPLVKAVQELDKENSELKAEIEMIKSVLSEDQQQRLRSLCKDKSLPRADLEMLLEQNSPNPFSEKTVIKFNIPVSAQQVEIKILSSEGKELKSFSISTKGAGQIEIIANSFAAGIYNYTLMIDGKAADSRQMILTR